MRDHLLSKPQGSGGKRADGPNSLPHSPLYTQPQITPNQRSLLYSPSCKIFLTVLFIICMEMDIVHVYKQSELTLYHCLKLSDNRCFKFVPVIELSTAFLQHICCCLEPVPGTPGGPYRLDLGRCYLTLKHSTPELLFLFLAEQTVLNPTALAEPPSQM